MHSETNNSEFNGRADLQLAAAEIAKQYGKSVSLIRLRLKEHLELNPGDHKEVAKPKGRREHVFSEGLVRRIFGTEKPSLMPALAKVLERNKGTASSVLYGVLESRQSAYEDYLHLVKEIIQNGDDVRIRCMTGQDFFSPGQAIEDALRNRKKDSKIKVLLLDPFGAGAKDRIAAESSVDRIAVESSVGIKTVGSGASAKNGASNPELGIVDLPFCEQFFRDATSTYYFMRRSVGDNGHEFDLDPRWIEREPHSLLVWAKQYALVEPYDYAAPKAVRKPDCIGRYAPIMIVRGDTPYHDLLREGFDYLFDKTETKDLPKLAEKYREAQRKLGEHSEHASGEQGNEGPVTSIRQ